MAPAAVCTCPPACTRGRRRVMCDAWALQDPTASGRTGQRRTARQQEMTRGPGRWSGVARAVARTRHCQEGASTAGARCTAPRQAGGRTRAPSELRRSRSFAGLTTALPRLGAARRRRSRVPSRLFAGRARRCLDQGAALGTRRSRCPLAPVPPPGGCEEVGLELEDSATFEFLGRGRVERSSRHSRTAAA